MEQQQRQQLKKYVDLLLRRKKVMAFFVLIAVATGLGAYLKAPRVYESAALIIYQRAKINPGSKFTPNVQRRTREMISTLTQQVTSRSSLEGIIKQFALYQKNLERLPMEDVVDFMRSNNIRITPDKGDVFRVTFQGDNPKKVMQVANAIAAKFIEEDLRYREERATQTSAYVLDEMNMAKGTLDKKEAVMRDYKLKYYNEMPQQFDANMRRLNALQDQLQKNQDTAQNLERTKVMIQTQISMRKEALDQLVTMGAGDQAGGPHFVANSPWAEVLSQVAQVKAALDNLRLRYTEKHPEVRRMEGKLQELLAKKAKLAKTMPQDEQKGGDEPGIYLQDKQLSQLELQLKNVSYNIKGLQKDGVEIGQQIKQYQAWINKTPVREAEWTALTRDYKQLSAHFQQLVVRNLEAESAESLERRQKGSQLKIVDSAYFPGKPIKPDFKKIMFMALALGLGLGGGLVLLLEVGDSSFRDADELETYLDLPVICSLPRIYSVKEKKMRRMLTVGWSAALTISVAVLLFAIVYFYKTGRIVI